MRRLTQAICVDRFLGNCQDRGALAIVGKASVEALRLWSALLCQLAHLGRLAYCGPRAVAVTVPRSTQMRLLTRRPIAPTESTRPRI